MRGGMNSEIIEAAIISQLKNSTCCALPTWFEEMNSTICVGMTRGNRADDCALRPNHRVLRTSCPRREILDTVTSLLNSLATNSRSFTEYIKTSLAKCFRIQYLLKQPLLKHILHLLITRKNCSKS